MTLVLAMYDYDYELNFSNGPKRLKSKPSSVLTIADSVITAFNKPTTRLVTSFRKTYEVDINIYQPYFNDDGSLRSYLQIQTKEKCLLSIAGSTLVAQHVLNIVTTHLGNLHYTYDFRKQEHKIIRNCQANPLRGGLYDDWNPNNSENLLNAEYINETVIHSIKHIIDTTAVSRAGDISQLNTNFLLSFKCPKTQEFHIYQYNLEVNNTGKLEILSKKISRDDIGIIGMADSFYERAKAAYLDCLEKNQNPREIMIDFMEKAIEEVHQKSYEIDYPIIAKRIDGRRIEKIIIQAPEAE